VTKVWEMRRMSNIQLILGDTTAGTGPIGKGRRKACGSIAPYARKTQNWSL
jgi:hypothetical protein